MSDTPITDALSTDPAIEKRDVPASVWRQMAEMERSRAELVEALREFGHHDPICEYVTNDPAEHPNCDCGFADVLAKARTLLARVEAK